MNVTVFGASGKVGRLVVQRLLDDGHHVVAFVHNSSPFTDNVHLKVVSGDIHNLEDVKRAVKGADAAVSALGSWGTRSKDIVSAGTANIIPAMNAEHIKRIVTLTGHDARATHDQLTILHRLTHALIMASPINKILRDGERHIRLLEASNLDWTVIRSPVMSESGSPSKYRFTTRRPKPWATINRHAVANAMVDLITDKMQYKKAPCIERSSQPE